MSNDLRRSSPFQQLSFSQVNSQRNHLKFPLLPESKQDESFGRTCRFRTLYFSSHLLPPSRLFFNSFIVPAVFKRTHKADCNFLPKGEKRVKEPQLITLANLMSSVKYCRKVKYSPKNTPREFLKTAMMTEGVRFCYPPDRLKTSFCT